MSLYHYHPPFPTNENLYHQTKPSEVTLEELEELRKIPKYNIFQKIHHVVYFMIFGIPKVIFASMFMFVAGPTFLIACAIWRILGSPASSRYYLKILWSYISRIFLFLIGFVKITFHGQVDPNARFITPNHTCFFDGWYFTPLGPRIIGKKELLDIPLLKDVSEIFEGIPVDRSKHTGISQVLIESANNPKEPMILIFPEGASTSGDYMFRFHLGAFLSDLPVQPTTIRYTIFGTSRDLHHISHFHHDWYMLFVFLGIPAIKIDITFLESMSIKSVGLDNPRAFADDVSLRIANELGVKLISLSSNSIFKKK
ncbi:Acyltransferase family protein [Tritrichomonas foetus]|uniref:Acyltransferase family protein n=1 Tax=Tritrichomonas foetus TaxID=1144522 RepID=A0A1J4KP06_9EUKA|nr:Acyltransferase family protein [Tritrichomonas foetus]|eukprot:OHT13025.1 Acyltransferase family protein [Tritrichomonas foetus]